MNEQETPIAQVQVEFLRAITAYIERMPHGEVKHFSLAIDSIIQNSQDQMVPVELGLLQALVDYLQEKPYKEVFQFVNILTGQNKPQVPQVPQVPQMPEPDVNISEHIPEGFDTNQTQEGE